MGGVGLDLLMEEVIRGGFGETALPAMRPKYEQKKGRIYFASRFGHVGLSRYTTLFNTPRRAYCKRVWWCGAS